MLKLIYFICNPNSTHISRFFFCFLKIKNDSLTYMRQLSLLTNVQYFTQAFWWSTLRLVVNSVLELDNIETDIQGPPGHCVIRLLATWKWWSKSTSSIVLWIVNCFLLLHFFSRYRSKILPVIIPEVLSARFDLHLFFLYCKITERMNTFQCFILIFNNYKECRIEKCTCIYFLHWKT